MRYKTNDNIMSEIHDHLKYIRGAISDMKFIEYMNQVFVRAARGLNATEDIFSFATDDESGLLRFIGFLCRGCDVKCIPVQEDVESMDIRSMKFSYSLRGISPYDSFTIDLTKFTGNEETDAGIFTDMCMSCFTELVDKLKNALYLV